VTHTRGTSITRLALPVMLLTVAATGWCAPMDGVATVCEARAERILMAESTLAPEFIYPEGKIDYEVIEEMLDQAMMSLTGETSVKDAWGVHFKPLDRVGIQLDVAPMPVHAAILEAVTLRLMRCGVPRENIIVYAGAESALFRAGFDLSGAPGRVRVMGADAEGYRKGLSRIVLDYCTAIINLSRLRIDPQLGMRGAVANCLATVPYPDQLRLQSEPEEMALAAASASLRQKTRLHIVDALRPGYAERADSRALETWLRRSILVSEDPVAIDAIGREILLEKLREAAPETTTLTPPVTWLLRAAEKYRLGVADLDAIKLTQIGP